MLGSQLRKKDQLDNSHNIQIQHIHRLWHRYSLFNDMK